MKNATDSDRDIALRFARMRESDTRQAPPFPDAAVLEQRQPLEVKSRFAAIIPKAAAAAVLVVGVGLLMLDTPTSDPGVIYADVMGESELMTDSLLSVSPGMLPEMTETMDVFDMELSLEEVYRGI